MTDDEIKNQKEPWVPTPEELEVLKEDLAQIIEHDTELLLRSRQEETLNYLKIYNKDRKTEIVDDIEGNPTVVTQWAEEPRDIEPTKSVRVKAKIREVQHPIPGLLDDKPETREQRRDRRLSLIRKDSDEEPELLDDESDEVTVPQEFFDKLHNSKADDKYAEQDDKLVEQVNEAALRPYTAPPVCPYCANFVYQGQIHCMGYCREKVQYEQ